MGLFGAWGEEKGLPSQSDSDARISRRSGSPSDEQLDEEGKTTTRPVVIAILRERQGVNAETSDAGEVKAPL